MTRYIHDKVMINTVYNEIRDTHRIINDLQTKDKKTIW